MTDVFQENGIIVLRKLAKIVRIFVDISGIKNQGVIYCSERTGPIYDPSTNILTMLANFLDTIIPFF